MIRPELFKIHHHRTPWALLAGCAMLTLTAPVFSLFRTPQPGGYSSNTIAVFELAGLLLAPVFGAWLIGHEYRQGTLRRVLAVDARRTRLLATKGAIGAAVMTAGLLLVAAVGMGLSWIAAERAGETLITDGIHLELTAAGFMALVTGAVAYLLSIILRSDTYAMLLALAVMAVVGPLASLIPTVGKYTPFAVANDISAWIIGNPDAANLPIPTAAIVLAATLGLLAIGAVHLFKTRDV